MKKLFYKYIIFSLIFFSLFFTYTSALALEISDYPSIPGLVKPVEGDLTTFITYWFGLLTYIAGALAVISFAIGAIQLIMSASNPSMSKDAKDRMLGSVLGLVLTLSAVVILRTINPALVAPTLTSLPGVDGVYYTNGSDLKSAPASANTSTIPDGYKKIKYICSNSNIAPALLVWTFSKENSDYSGSANTQRITCGGEVDLSGAESFKTAFETAGIYYCMGGCNGNICSGYMSEVLGTGEEEIPSPFRGSMKGVTIVNDTNNSTYYGLILHKEAGAADGGECTEPILSTKNNFCATVNISAFSVDAFQWNKADSDSSGNGVTFYSGTYGWNTDAEIQSGYFSVEKEDIKNSNIFRINADQIKFDYSEIDSTEAQLCIDEYPYCKSTNDDDQEYIDSGYCCDCPNLKQCSGEGSIQIKGDYVVALYSHTKENKLYCQTFIEDVQNLSAYEYVEPGNDVEYVNIIPTK